MALRALYAPALPRTAAGCRRVPARAACCAAEPAPRRVATSLSSRAAPVLTLLSRTAPLSPRLRRARPRPPPGARASVDGAFAAALAAWEATQRVVLWVTAAGLAVCVAIATTARGRATLLTAWTEFQARAPRRFCPPRA
jgi:hypothetical protein